MNRPVCAAVAWLSLACPATADEPPAVDAKLDRGLTGDDGALLPVFVRFTDQLFRSGGDYEAFAEAHENDKRSELREFVLRTLRERQRASWGRIAPLVDELSRDGQLREVERFWIVGGFACDATASACARLA